MSALVCAGLRAKLIICAGLREVFLRRGAQLSTLVTPFWWFLLWWVGVAVG